MPSICRSMIWPVLLALLFVAVPQSEAQSRIVDALVHSPGLAHNLLGDPADQPVSIYLPAAYEANPARRFPVLYFLHGFADTEPRHHAAEAMGRQMDAAIAAGTVQPFILVLPNGSNRYHGSFYANSSVTGDWDDYVTRDVVGYVDAHFRTEASPAHRAIAGHSMGGFGALRLAFLHPEVFGAVYALSPCCTDIVADFGPSNGGWARAAALTSPEAVAAAVPHGDFFAGAFSAFAAALAPDPASKTYFDLPFAFDKGQTRTNPAVFSSIAGKLPANMVLPLLPNIARLRGIAIDFGAQENFAHIIAGAEEINARLTAAGISNSLEVYQGDHGSHVGDRIAEHMLPWISQHVAP